jgi:cation diffusion facilitator family transporter
VSPSPTSRAHLKRYAWLSIAAALVTIVIKTLAYLLTGSVGLLSDALESLVNLAGAVMALGMLIIAARPADDDHAFGHGKAEYFSSMVEGVLILLAALGIGVTAVERLFAPKALEQLGLGLGLSTSASLVNLAVSRVLLRAGRRANSITLEANAHHLMTDVWTSAGVLAGVGAVSLTGWQRFDPLTAIVVAANIVWTGVRIIRRSVQGLMDVALPPADVDAITRALEPHLESGIKVHAIRTRQAGARRFVSLHVLVPGSWQVKEGHDLLERIEADIRAALPGATLLTHLESIEDPAAWEDVTLDRDERTPPG